MDILDSKYLLGNIKNYYHNDSKKGLILFDTYFNFTSTFIKNTIKKGYVFSGLILTNSYEIIFNLNSKSYELNKNKFHSSGKKEFIKKSINGMSKEEIEQFIIENTNRKNKEKLLKEQYIIKKDKSNKKIYKILVCKTNEKLNEFVNRDINSVKNMIKIISNYINTNYKPKTFVLGTTICNHTLCVI